ncbi:LAETG motif-containing sortase-dependent surface protein [Streptomyces sp. NBC_00344]|uniref:LAETG motif-containing sortase-dependent surface protein n=1 Tax=Streptomyces sp. NBC_00344 TaxID=2975720 RepID=UPI002E1F9E3D
MTVSNRTWRLRGAFIAAAASVVGVGLCAVPAQAHTPVWSLTCSGGTVDLKAYNDHVTNTVTISVDGKNTVDAQKFGSSFHQDLTLDKASEETVRLIVKAGDGQQYSLDETKTSPACEGAPSATPSPSASVPPSEAPSSEAPAPSKSASDTPSAAAPAPSPSSSAPTDLAETGSSSSTPLIAGAAAVVIVAGGGIMFAARKRRSSQS